jgi:general stress protein 26
MTTTTDKNQQIHQLRRLIQDIDSGMLTTVDADGSLHGRPMYKGGDIDFEGRLWFFTHGRSHKVIEIEQCQQVGVTFASSPKHCYVSISGTAQLVRDPNQLQQLWKPELQTWFPQGLNEPDIALLKVTIKRVDYWDSRSCSQAQIISF